MEEIKIEVPEGAVVTETAEVVTPEVVETIEMPVPTDSDQTLVPEVAPEARTASEVIAETVVEEVAPEVVAPVAEEVITE